MRLHTDFLGLAVALALGACGTSSSSSASSDGGAAPRDGGVDATASDGGGVCCPVADDFCCGGDTGGWAPSADKCPTSGSCDGLLYNGTDSHGCPFIGTGAHAGAVCCGCPVDAGDQ